MPVNLKRAFDPPAPQDGKRILVERLWPRGLKKDRAKVDLWLRELAPSNELRRWFRHRAPYFAIFRKRYLRELAFPDASCALEQLYAQARASRSLTLLFAAKDSEHNNAVVLKELLEGMRKPPTGSGPSRAAAAPSAKAAQRPRPR